MKKNMLAAAACAALTAGVLGSTAMAADYTVGICQLIEHPALDAATQGFKDAIVEELGEDAVDFIEQNAQGEPNQCATIMSDLVNKADLIMANATPALQAAQAATAEIPVLGTSVTDYATALDISDWTGTVGGNISGTSDLAPLDQQAAMLQELFPDAETVGLLYCTAEANSQYQVDVIQGYLEDLGYTCTQYGFSEANDLSAVAATAASESEVLYVPTDNTAAANAGLVDGVCRPEGVPVIAGEEGICGGCGVATLSISYYDLGYTTGQMAVRILRDGEDISEMAVEYAPQVTKKYNATICADLGITVPEDYVAIEE